MEAYLWKDERASRVRVFAKPQKGAEKIVTEYSLRQNFAEYALVDIRLHSGKTHQIRAHMAFIGHPVAGDDKYGDEALNKKYGVHRQLLVAKSLRLQCGGGLAYLNEKKFTSRFSPRLEG